MMINSQGYFLFSCLDLYELCMFVHTTYSWIYSPAVCKGDLTFTFLVACTGLRSPCLLSFAGGTLFLFVRSFVMWEPYFARGTLDSYIYP